MGGLSGIHRSLGHSTAKGMDNRGMMAEFFGRSNGCCGGKARRRASGGFQRWDDGSSIKNAEGKSKTLVSPTTAACRATNPGVECRSLRPAAYETRGFCMTSGRAQSRLEPFLGRSGNRR